MVPTTKRLDPFYPREKRPVNTHDIKHYTQRTLFLNKGPMSGREFRRLLEEGIMTVTRKALTELERAGTIKVVTCGTSRIVGLTGQMPDETQVSGEPRRELTPLAVYSDRPITLEVIKDFVRNVLLENGGPLAEDTHLRRLICTKLIEIAAEALTEANREGMLTTTQEARRIVEIDLPRERREFYARVMEMLPSFVTCALGKQHGPLDGDSIIDLARVAPELRDLGSMRDDDLFRYLVFAALQQMKEDKILESRLRIARTTMGSEQRTVWRLTESARRAERMNRTASS